MRRFVEQGWSDQTPPEFDYYRHRKDELSVQQSAWALNLQGKPKWMPTVIDSQLGPLTFTVRLSDGRLWKRHQDHLRERRHDETESVGAAQPRPEVLLPPPPLPQLTSTDKERYVTPLKSATTSDSAPARVPESPVANRMPPRETVLPIIVASPTYFVRC